MRGSRLLLAGCGPSPQPSPRDVQTRGEGDQLRRTSMTDKRARNEIIKENSHQLRGTLAEGLDDVITGNIAEDDHQLIKFHGSYIQDDRDVRGERAKKKLEKAFSFMLRLRIPGGLVTPKQWLALDDIASQLRQRHAASDNARDVSVSRRHQVEPAPHHAGDQRGGARYDCSLRRRQPQRHDGGQSVSVESPPPSLRPRQGDQRASAAEDRRLSRDLARRRKGRGQRRARPTTTKSRCTASTICRANSKP